MQMYAAEKYGMSQATRFDRFTVQMTHPDGAAALLSGAISAHFTSPPFHQRELKAPRVHTVMTTDGIMKGSTTFTMLYTTTAFYKKNPKAVEAVLAALEEANALIRAFGRLHGENDDRKMVAEALLGSTTEIGFTAEELLEVVSDPAVKFTTTPENIMKYADFMHQRKTIKNKPANWQEMFFPEIHEAPGS
jgi:NitT/TauT family transport system substrate-binding protein